MKKTTILLHQSYVEDVIKKLHETGLMEISALTKEEAETLGSLDLSQMHPEATLCQNYINRIQALSYPCHSTAGNSITDGDC